VRLATNVEPDKIVKTHCCYRSTGFSSAGKGSRRRSI
jgi:hypothetical protein